MVGMMGVVRAMAQTIQGALIWKTPKEIDDAQRMENERLRMMIRLYEQAFQECHDQKAENGGISVDRSMVVYEQLKQRVASPAFLEKLKPSQDLSDGASSSMLLRAEDGSYVKADVGNPSSWMFSKKGSGSDHGEMIKEVEDGLGSDGYVVVNVEDIVESIAGYVARYISSVPQAKNLSPTQLQEVMTEAFSNAERKGWLRSLYSTGRFLYTAGSWGVAALSIDKNPVVVRAASMAVWTSCWLILKLIT
ncbi:hypothetical protein M758_2G163800 [Ceratodon purpureus]|nr:hypothetical protein M758_2G163800 [Ceratodon purpureus]